MMELIVPVRGGTISHCGEPLDIANALMRGAGFRRPAARDYLWLVLEYFEGKGCAQVFAPDVLAKVCSLTEMEGVAKWHLERDTPLLSPVCARVLGGGGASRGRLQNAALFAFILTRNYGQQPTRPD